MANHKSAVKAHDKSLKNKARNQSILTKIKTFIKKVEACITGGSSVEAQSAMRNAESEIMRGVSKGALKKNSASRKVSRLTKKVKALETK
ncbi:MAG: 30S ribosomal protein S20 [Alphaproteobacteria bacterium]|jgi:small subunit ribosomal protein S20|nr:30S ribosomal protein S20 [Candidatus Jidaibacter sp.]